MVVADVREVDLPRPRPSGPVGDRKADWRRVDELEWEGGGMGGRFLRENRLKVRFCAGFAMAYWYSLDSQLNPADATEGGRS